ncbi:ATP-binding protein [Mangrovimonas sp. AS39]|uniref:AAA family ATPase n=1 Tax=Mangrovimonas futianensis TaxID=2895523 RepID=UPI001E61CED2|nr:AAA family ATPase [Mangrovimonas futianensis]MCF1192509.1 ATP-binding protein [Mangrovimonas futianensis]MCF1196161.1 ATP-binding protein [Mangrovimonas futianensis]
MITSIFLRHFKIYKGITFIPISEGIGFSSLIGENGVGKSSVLEAIDCVLNKKNNDWPINNEAKNEGVGGDNFPYITPVFLIKKHKLRNAKAGEQELYKKAEQLSSFIWDNNLKTKSKSSSEFNEHKSELKKIYSKEDYFLIIVGKKHNNNSIYFGGYHNYIDFIGENPQIKPTEEEIQSYFKGFYEYLISHYSYLYIPVETDVFTYTKLETIEMQKLMDKNIQDEIVKAIKPNTLKQINKDLDGFVKDVENILEEYEYKGHYKNSLTMPDLVSKIIEAYFSIKVLNKKPKTGKKLIPVSELSSGEKRKALIDVAYSFLLKNENTDNNIILAVDEPEASLHISACYDQFEKLFSLSKNEHQIIVSTHWYGFLPIVLNGSATSISKKETNETSAKFFNLYNYRETITQSRKKTKGPLPIDYNIKSYNDLVQSILFSIIKEEPYNWIICEGLSEKIYFEVIFAEEIKNKKLRILPLGSFKEVRKLYNSLISPIKDPDYKVKGKVICLIDTDSERVEVDYENNNKNLFFYRLWNNKSKKYQTELIDVDRNSMNPPTEIEDCLSPYVYKQTLIEFMEEYETIKNIISNCPIIESATNSYSTFDLRDSEKDDIKSFFDDKEGYNKIRFAEKYVDILKKPLFSSQQELDWISKIKKIIN